MKREAIMKDTIFDYENPNLWSYHIDKIMKKHLDEEDIKSLLDISTKDNRYIEIEDIYEISSEDIFYDIKRYLNENDCYVLLYHATATNNIKPFLEKGLCKLNSSEKNKYARELFNQEEFPELTDEVFEKALKEHMEYLGMELREHRISFMTNKKHLLENETHYLVYGSEYIFILSQRLGYTYKSVLREKLKPTLLTCKVPFNQLNYDFQEMTIKNVIIKYVENLIYPNEIYENDAEIYIHSNLDAKHIIKYEHPENVTCTKFF